VKKSFFTSTASYPGRPTSMSLYPKQANADRPADPPYPPPSVCAECCGIRLIFSSPPIRPHHGRAHQLTLVTSAGKDCVQGRSADLPGTAR